MHSAGFSFITEREAHTPINSDNKHTANAVPNVHAALNTVPVICGREKIKPYLIVITAGTISGPMIAPATHPKKVIAALINA